jgi:hypothetical protein
VMVNSPPVTDERQPEKNKKLAEENRQNWPAAKRREKNSNLLHEGFPKLGAPHMVVLVCLTQGVSTYI